MDNKLIAALRTADEESLTAMANRGLYKRAVKDAEGAALVFSDNESSASVDVGGEKCVITAPLGESKCSCPSRTVCRHILTAVLLLKRSLPKDDAPVDTPDPPAAPVLISESENAVEPEEAPADDPESVPTPAEIDKIYGCADMCLGLIAGLLSCGLIRAPESVAEDFELAAVRCHAVRMAECERQMRALSGRLKDLNARRASFNASFFTERLLETAALLERIRSGDISEDTLGSFRSRYVPVGGLLDLIPVGQRTVSGGEYDGDIFYFLNAERGAEQRFFSFSDLRPTFYETGRKRIPHASPWGLGVPLKRMMKKRMVLEGARVSGGKLSSSKETVVAAQSDAVLDCGLIHGMLITDFREIAFELDRRGSDDETDRMFFIYPKCMTGFGFDKHTQRLVMTFEDDNGNTVDCVVKYRTETKAFISQLERICGKIAKSDKRKYSLLVSAYFDEGRLRLFPIEVYDFIKPTELHSFELPSEYELSDGAGYCAEEIGRHLHDVKDHLVLIVRTGLQSEQKFKDLISRSRELGMTGLAGLLSDTSSAADKCRHSVTDESRAALDAMLRLTEYIDAANKRVELVSALYDMIPKGEGL